MAAPLLVAKNAGTALELSRGIPGVILGSSKRRR
jgi:hypothetical protein